MGLFDRRGRDSYDGENLIDEIYGRRQEQEISRLEENAEKVEAYERMQSRIRRRNALRVLAAVLLLGVLTVAVMGVGYKFLFIISDITVTGDSPYTADEIALAAGVDKGDALFSFSSAAAEERLIASLPYISSLEVDRHIPDSVDLTVKSEKAVYYTEIYGKIYLMSDSLRLLGEAGDADLSALTWLRLPGVKEARLGGVPVFRDPDTGELLRQVTDHITGSALNGRITQLDLRSIYTLDMVCDNKYLLRFGDYSDTDTKLRIADAVLADEMFKTSNKARIDLSSLSETIVVVDNQLDFSK